MTDFREPLRLTPLERYVDDLMRFENFERYRAQSAQCRDGGAAAVSERSRGERYARAEALDARLPSDDVHWSRA